MNDVSECRVVVDDERQDAAAPTVEDDDDDEEDEVRRPRRGEQIDGDLGGRCPRRRSCWTDDGLNSDSS